MVAWALLQEARRRAGLTQAELARRAGVPQSTVAKIERGRRDPSLSTLERLVRAAGLEPVAVAEPITVDEILDLHLYLKNFQGTLSELIQQPDRSRG